MTDATTFPLKAFISNTLEILRLLVTVRHCNCMGEKFRVNVLSHVRVEVVNRSKANVKWLEHLPNCRCQKHHQSHVPHRTGKDLVWVVQARQWL